MIEGVYTITREEVWQGVLLESHYVAKKGGTFGSLAAWESNRLAIEAGYGEALAWLMSVLMPYDVSVSDDGSVLSVVHAKHSDAPAVLMTGAVEFAVRCALLATWFHLCQVADLESYYRERATAKLTELAKLECERRRPVWN